MQIFVNDLIEILLKNYNPDSTRNAAKNEIKLLGKFDATENLENVEGGGKKLAMVACSSLGFLLLFAVGSVLCFKKHSKGSGTKETFCVMIFL